MSEPTQTPPPASDQDTDQVTDPVPVEPRRAPRPSSAQWHPGLLYELRSIVEAHPRDTATGAEGDEAGAWTTAGVVTPVGGVEPGWFRTRRLTDAEVDRLDRAVLAPGGRPGSRRFVVTELRRGEHGCLVRVQAGAPDDGLVLCLPRREPTARYRALLRGLGTAEAVKPLQPFARGDLDRLPRQPEDAGAHTRAVAAAAAAGLHAVWAPPGTGATTVIADALGRALDTGQRCLLVSTDAGCVDDAVLALLEARHPQTGAVARVGPAYRTALAERPEVGLAALVEAAQPETVAVRDASAARVLELREAPALVEVRQARARLAAFTVPIPGDSPDSSSERVSMSRAGEVAADGRGSAAGTGFDAEAYRAARGRLDDRAERASIAGELTSARDEVERCRQEETEAHTALVEAVRTVQTLRVTAAADRLDRVRAELNGLPRGPRHWRLRRELVADVDRAERTVGAEQRRAEGLAADRPEPSLLDPALLDPKLVDRSSSGASVASGASSDGSTASATDRVLTGGPGWGRAVGRVRPAHERATRAAEALSAAETRVAELTRRVSDLEARPAVVDGDETLCAAAEAAGLPELADRLPGLTEAGRAAEEALAAAADELEAVEGRLRAAATQHEPLVLDHATVTATTFDRLLDSPALAARRWDLVLVDRAAAAPLPWVAYAATRATRGCLLVGDHLQPGPPRDPVFERGHYWDHDVFEHVGLLSPRAAQHHPGCVLLDVQRRYGAEATDLLNRTAYQGVLGGRPQPGAELVWVDTDGLPDARVTGPEGRSWAAGARISRALVGQQLAEGRSVAVVTPYPAQVAVTRRLLDAGGPALAEVPVGTAAQLAGRVFDVCVFDTVEDGGGWVARARRDPVGPDADHRRDALRDVVVGVTTGRRLGYVIAAGRALRGDRGTPLGELAQLCAEGRVPRLGARRALDDASRGSAGEVGGVDDHGDRSVVDA